MSKKKMKQSASGTQYPKGAARMTKKPANSKKKMVKSGKRRY